MKDFKIGLVGCGHISMTHLKAWAKTEGCQVTGVFDVNRALAEKRARDFNVDAIYNELEKLIAECDVIDVCTPPQTHNDIARKVIEAGRHLVIEKPLVIDVSEWDRIQRLLAHSPSKLAVVHNLKYTHSVQLAKRWVEQGRIGKILRLTRYFLTNPETDRMLVGNTHWSHSLPGGRWFETLPHELYLFHYFAGPLELSGVMALHTAQAPAGAPADDVLISFKGEHCFGSVHYSANCRLNKRMFILHGTEGVIHIDMLGGVAVRSGIRDDRWNRAVGVSYLDAASTLLRMIPDRSNYLLQRIRGETPHSHLIQAFGRYLQGRGPAPTPLDEIDYVVRNCDKVGREIDRQLSVAAGA